MKIISSITLLLVAATLTVQATQAAQADESDSLWYQNAAGSRMELIFSDTGGLSGTYVSALGCAKDTPAPLIGWSNGKAITFTVNFGDCGSITSWAGHVNDDGTIDTIWTLSRGETSEWNTLLTGSAHFELAN